MSSVRLCIPHTRLASTLSDSNGLRNISSPTSTLACYKFCTQTSTNTSGTGATSLLPIATVHGCRTRGHGQDERTPLSTRSSILSSMWLSEVLMGGLKTPRAASLGSMPAPTPKRISGRPRITGTPHGRTRPWKFRRFPCGNNAMATKSCKQF